jgi:hypothetical protein
LSLVQLKGRRGLIVVVVVLGYCILGLWLGFFCRQHNKRDQRDLMLNLPIGLKWKKSAWLGPNNKANSAWFMFWGWEVQSKEFPSS